MIYREAKSAKGSGKRLHHIEIHEGEDGGHKVVHHFHSAGMSIHEPDEHYFGKGEHEAMFSHVAKHLHVPEPLYEAEEEGEDPGLGDKDVVPAHAGKQPGLGRAYPGATEMHKKWRGGPA